MTDSDDGAHSIVDVNITSEGDNLRACINPANASHCFLFRSCSRVKMTLRHSIVVLGAFLLGLHKTPLHNLVSYIAKFDILLTYRSFGE